MSAIGTMKVIDMKSGIGLWPDGTVAWSTDLENWKISITINQQLWQVRTKIEDKCI